MSVYERLKAKWLETGVPVNDGISQVTIDRFEHKNSIALPSTFKEYLLVVNGMKNGQTDENLVSFLSLDAIDQEARYEISASEVDVIFAEFSIYSHYYVLRIKRSGEQVAILAADGEHEKQIADSFEGFVSSYLADPSKMAYCWA